jgi:3',5'-cyclic-AMP phosphodiesterase
MRILHLSDTHVLGHGALHRDLVDTAVLLREAVDASATLPRHDLVVVTGDVSDDGTVDSYEFARRQVERLTDAWGCPAVWVPGNHDQGDGFREVLGDGGAPVDVRGLRVVALDTHLPLAGYGRIGDQALAALRETLAVPAPRGTLLVLHHAPIADQPSVLHGALRLVDAAALADALVGTDVHLVLGGHVHEPVVAEAAGVPVIAGPAVANRAETGTPAEEAAVRGTGWLSIELADEPDEPGDPDERGEPGGSRAGAGGAPVRVIEHRLDRADDGEPVFRFTADQVRRVGKAAGYPGWTERDALTSPSPLIVPGSDRVAWQQGPPFAV